MSNFSIKDKLSKEDCLDEEASQAQQEKLDRPRQVVERRDRVQWGKALMIPTYQHLYLYWKDDDMGDAEPA